MRTTRIGRTGNTLAVRATASAAIVMAAAICGNAYGAAYFKVADGDWNTAANWVGGLPVGNASATVGTTTVGGLSTATARIGADVGTSAATISPFVVGDQAGTNGTVVQTAGNSYFWNATIGNNGTGTFTADASLGAVGVDVRSLYLGGTVAANTTGTGTFNLLKGANLTVRNGTFYIGHAGTGSFNQVGGAVTVGNGAPSTLVWLGVVGGSRGAYNLSGNGTLTMAESGNGASFQVGRYGPGTFKIGDATSGGTVAESGTGVNVVDFNIGVNSTAAGSSVNGWGTISLKGAFTNGGLVKANGYGTDRTLDISQYASVSGTAGGTNGTNGYYAVNHGKLKLKDLAVHTGTVGYNWALANGSGNPTMVNDANITFTGLSATNQTLGISLLATDRADYHAGLTKPIGVWDMTPSAGLSFTSASLVFRYDNALALSMGLAEIDLKLFQYTNGTWQLVPSTVDATNHWMTTTGGVNSLSQFAISAIPEPVALSMAALSMCMLMAGRGSASSRRRGAVAR